MRLSHIKLAGFKSFVDPVHIPVPGQLVGVVGPNGCGKSNVIDAVRWVLGESSAKHLRGETMQDVIFNGSGERKPVNRASVELVFDNSLGKAAGPWGQYAEISVKRVLERDGESAYFINNLHVRRKDVADIFLGTGLGGRGYAIIEQGMISRIVDARPEDLRTFLEEAAGISKYRERRRETELRLDDTRENLVRVDDIVQELAKQIEHLEAQALVATRYRELEASIKLAQQLLWFLRKQEAAHQRARLARDIEQSGLELEAETARLRELESSLEHLRQHHYAAADGVHDAQGSLYEVNAEVARLEQALAHQRDSRRRVESQVLTAEQERAEAERQGQALRESLRVQRETLDDARRHREVCDAQQQAAAAALPAAEAVFVRSRDEVGRLQQDAGLCTNAIEVEATRQQHSERLLAQLAQRRQRLEQEQAGLQDAEPEGLEQLGRELDDMDQRYQVRRAGLESAEAELPGLEQAHRATADRADTAARELSALEARCTALELLQKQVSRSGEMHAWLDNQQLDGSSRLWQGIRVEPGWEDALEAVLRERLSGIALDNLQRAADWLTQPPPGKISFFQKRDGHAFATELAGRRPLLGYVTFTDPTDASVMSDWLDRVYVVQDAAQGFAERASLPAGALLVCPQGHVFTRNSVSFHASDSEVHGILSRQREIEQMAQLRLALEADAEAARDKAAIAQSELEHKRAEALRLREETERLQQQRHDHELHHVRLSQQAERTQHRQGQIVEELGEIAADCERETAQRRSAEDRLLELQFQSGELRRQVDAARDNHQTATAALDGARDTLQASQQRFQEATFTERVMDQKLNDIENSIQRLLEQEQRARTAAEGLRLELDALNAAPLQSELDRALTLRLQREHALIEARGVLEEAERALKEAEQLRLGCEQRLGPLRERLGELRLKEQEARLVEENFGAQLGSAGADESALAAKLEKGMRPSVLQSEIGRLGEEIAALGAVNLAALEQLDASRSRNQYLEAQSRDLREAVTTLQSAIRRMDRETRERLQSTFDQLNDNLAQMFPSLFGGGEARLVMTGEEILDAGLQIIARPPGKKNSSIHLLSGGEKALTALALVFSLFQLNPAPFCLLDEVDAPLDDTNTERFCALVRKMAQQTQFMFISHNKISMEMAEQLIGVTMAELGVSKVVAVDIEEALRLTEEEAAA
ncbi:MAG TPA: chromosome segregation protein SMC [Burkholderiales bacterium]|nr:chromosome segregation protein SMC [Burkholderiales bacterium]